MTPGRRRAERSVEGKQALSRGISRYNKASLKTMKSGRDQSDDEDIKQE
jgi:hypothetical protein